MVSNLGTWMHFVAASWLMASLTVSVTLVALLSTADAVPSFALSLPAGAMADVFDRRRLIIATQAIQLAVAAVLAAVTLAGGASPALLLATTTALAVGATLGRPAFAAVTPELVSPEQLPAAISVNSLTSTLAQTVGPALGGILVAAVGAGAVFLINAASFLGVIIVIAAWRRAPQVHKLPPEHIAHAIRTGIRYTANAPELAAVLVRDAAYAVSYIALPTLLVLVTRRQLHGTAGDYGLLLGLAGVGGVVAAFTLPQLRARLQIDLLVTIASIIYGAVLWAVAASHTLPPVAAAMIVAGFCQVTVTSSLMIGAQKVLPSWVRGRGLAIFQMTYQAALAGGAVIWGAVATRFGIPVALEIGGTLLALSTLLGFVAKLSGTERVDVRSCDQAIPNPHVAVDPDDGPVLVTIEYRVPAEGRVAFGHALADLRRARRREGAIHWSVYTDVASPETHVENYVVSSWTEHERQAERRTERNQSAFDRVVDLHAGPGQPVERYLLGQHFRRGDRAG